MSFLVRRLGAAVLLVLVASALVFLAIRFLPGDPVLLLLGEQGASDPEVVLRMRAKLGLDQPLLAQLFHWVINALRFEFGTSLQTGLPVAEELARRIPRSLELIGGGLFVAVAAGIPLGVIAARYDDRPVGWLASGVAVFGFSAPVFVTGVLLVLAFSLGLGWLPSSGYAPLSEGVGTHLSFAVLPWLAMGFAFMGVVIRMTRASLLDTLKKDFVRTARAKGITERAVVYRHALPNSLIPVVAVIGVRAGNLLGGTVIIETLFNWPGLSSLLVRACYDRDYPLIQGSLLAIFVLFVLISLLVDLVLGLLDPKLRDA
jgi:peptide/nickel transport system permease protein